MASKVLRSLIQEKIPFDLRVDIELLSRRRDISNAEKQEELFKLLRKYEINDVTPLGSGTNRYAFKMNGFVIKVATDHEGKIDNLKEFKMAKRLFPHVIKIYEVSKNGTLQVCEYIQPFQSFAEMNMYKDQILDILKELSSVYLIGDVGITSKNYANWGLRIGINKPVCLDFAYVYEVKSELFVCRYCKTNSVLVPNNDFTALYCPAPNCGRKYLFEDIKSKISDDMHRREIGDLTEEGYLMTESNVETELTEERSNYLVKKRAKKEEVSKAEEVVQIEKSDDFFIPEHIEEEKTMSNNNVLHGFVIAPDAKINGRFRQAEVTSVSVTPKDENCITADNDLAEKISQNSVIPATIIAIGSETKKKKVAPTVGIEVPTVDEKSTTTEETTPNVIFAPLPEINEAVEVEEKSCEPMITAVPAEPIEETPVEEESATAEEVETTVQVKAEVKVNEKKVNHTTPYKNGSRIYQPTIADDGLIHNLPRNFARAVSEVSSRICNKWFTEINLFEELKEDLKTTKLIQPFAVYKSIQNALYHSLITLLKFEKTEGTKQDGTPKAVYNPPETLDAELFSTVVFINTFFNDADVWDCESMTEAINVYKSKYSNWGIHPDIRKILSGKLKNKVYDVKPIGLNIILSTIADTWIASDNAPDPMPTKSIDAKEEANSPGEEETVEEPLVEETSAEDLVESIENTISETEEEVDDIVNDMESVEESAESDKYEEDEEDDEDDVFYSPNRIDIYLEEDIDCVILRSKSIYGDIAIPMYVHWDSIPATMNPTSEIDDRNGIYDWLAYTIYNYRFWTAKADDWMAKNDVEDTTLKFAVLDEADDGECLIGIFSFEGVWLHDLDGNVRRLTDLGTMAKVNVLLEDNLSSMDSHFAKSFMDEDSILDEEAIEELFRLAEQGLNDGSIISSDDDEDEDDEGAREDSREDAREPDYPNDEYIDRLEAEEAALSVIMGKSIDEEYDESRTYIPIRRKSKNRDDDRDRDRL